MQIRLHAIIIGATIAATVALGVAAAAGDWRTAPQAKKTDRLPMTETAALTADTLIVETRGDRFSILSRTIRD